MSKKQDNRSLYLLNLAAFAFKQQQANNARCTNKEQSIIDTLKVLTDSKALGMK